MEYAMRMLHNEKYVVQNLSKAIILGSKLPVIKSTINDAEIQSFVKNLEILDLNTIKLSDYLRKRKTVTDEIYKINYQAIKCQYIYMILCYIRT